jgi:hypothetical protein
METINVKVTVHQEYIATLKVAEVLDGRNAEELTEWELQRLADDYVIMDWEDGGWLETGTAENPPFNDNERYEKVVAVCQAWPEITE